MEKEQDQEVQETQEEVKISAKELEDLKHKAEVSSQNFERLKAKEKEAEELKARLEELDSTDPDDYSGEGVKLQRKIDELESRIQSQTSEFQMDKLYEQYPTLKENSDMFKTYSEDPANSGMPLATRAKAFLVENDLLKEQPRRKGLERQTGGKPIKASSGKLTAEDAKRLRTENPRKYLAMIQAGTLEIERD